MTDWQQPPGARAWRRGTEWELAPGAPQGPQPARPLAPGGTASEPPAGAQSGPPGRLRPRQRGRRRRRWVVALSVGAVTVLVLAGVVVAYAVWRVGQVQRIAVDGIVPVGSGSPQNILIAGTDSRAGESASAAQHFGSAQEVAGQRSDVIILIHIDPAHAKVSVLSVPRDLFVPIAGSGTSNRINVALGQSPTVLVETVEQALGITVNHYAQENFAGLQGLTDAVGGVCMDFPYPARDGSPTGTGNESGLNIPTAGTHVLNGAMALALVRSRYFQYYEGGEWHAEGTGDIGRTIREHQFFRALFAKAVHVSSRNPFSANAFMGKAVHDITVDRSFTSLGLLRLALHLKSVKPGSIPSWTLPSRAVNNYEGYGDVLFPVSSQSAVIAAWQSYGAPAPKVAGPASGGPPPAGQAIPPTPVPPWDPTPC